MGGDAYSQWSGSTNVPVATDIRLTLAQAHAFAAGQLGDQCRTTYST
jgi:hypothetical protein